MRLDTPFVRLPLCFDAERLAAEVLALPDAAWRPHPQGYPGNTALSLVAVDADPGNDLTRGPMLPTPWLSQLPYVQQAMAALGCPIGRSRLMRIDGNGEASRHVDTNYYWATHLRIHIPVLTTADVEFQCGAASVHMAAGECWVFDTWSLHNVINPSPTRRIHLVCDSVGAPALWNMIDHGHRPTSFHSSPDPHAAWVAFDPAISAQVPFEYSNQPVVMTPFELLHWSEFALSELRLVCAAQHPGLLQLRHLLTILQRAWTDAWTRHGQLPRGHASFDALLRAFNQSLEAFRGLPRLQNGVEVVQLLRQLLVRSALNPEIADAQTSQSTTAKV